MPSDQTRGHSSPIMQGGPGSVQFGYGSCNEITTDRFLFLNWDPAGDAQEPKPATARKVKEESAGGISESKLQLIFDSQSLPKTCF